jgi:hypothetical protein
MTRIVWLHAVRDVPASSWDAVSADYELKGFATTGGAAPGEGRYFWRIMGTTHGCIVVGDVENSLQHVWDLAGPQARRQGQPVDEPVPGGRTPEEFADLLGGEGTAGHYLNFGCGCFRASRRVYEAMPPPWFDFGYDATLTQKTQCECARFAKRLQAAGVVLCFSYTFA